MLHIFEKKFLTKEKEIKHWLDKKKSTIKSPIYSSIDIRNAGFKIAPVDVNVFPGGFNNLCPNYCKNASEFFKKHINKYYKTAQKILIFPEAHTKNKYYFENLNVLQKIIKNAGFEVLISHDNPQLLDLQEFETASEEKITLDRIFRNNDTIKTFNNFQPDIILLNNDLSNGLPEILKNIHIPMIPNMNLGWFRRSKMENLNIYQKLIEEFAQILDLDPWFFYPLSKEIKNVDFQKKEGIEEIAEGMNKIFIQIQDKYNEYEEILRQKIKPYVFIKNSSGTYGIGVKSFESVDEFMNMNRKDRNKLSVGKGSQAINKIIIQEGLPTVDRCQHFIAEPVIYLIGNNAIGGFFRLNDKKSDRENLNSKGMQFSKLCFHKITDYHNTYTDSCSLDSLQNIYYTIAEIASLAAGIEEQAFIK